MSVYEFKLVPAPLRPVQKKVRSSAEDGFCVTLTEMVNDMAADGWEYVRCESLPGPSRGWKFWKPREERQVFVFRRLRDDSFLLPAPEAFGTDPLIPPRAAAPQPNDPPVSRVVSRRPPSVKATTPRPQSVVVPPPVAGRSAARRPSVAAGPAAAPVVPPPQPQTRARPPMAPEGDLSETPRRVSDPAAVERIKGGARRISVRADTDPAGYAAE